MDLKVKIQKFLPGNRARVLRLIAGLDEISGVVPSIKKINVVKRDKEEVLMDWHIDVDNLPIHWCQRNTFDRSEFAIHFESLKGDLENLKGTWRFRRGPGGSTRVELEASAVLDIPGFDEVVYPQVQMRLQKCYEAVLTSIENMMIYSHYEKHDGKHKSKLKGFVVMGHPYNVMHLVRIFEVFKPDVRNLSEEFLLKIFELAPSYLSSEICNFKSKTGKTTHGYFVMCPIIPDMARLNPEVVFQKVLEGCHIGEQLGAGVLALGGFTSIVGEKYLDQMRAKTRMPITTGNTFTASLALDGIRKACGKMNIDLKGARVIIIGGTGDIGSACARVLVKEVRELVITGRTPAALQQIQSMLQREKGAKVTISIDNNEAVEQADVIIAAASSTQSLVDVERIKPGAVVCDLAYPKNISYSSQNLRNDILVFSGGLASVPTPFNLGFDVGLPSPDILYGCFSEAILLSLEERYENFSEGKGNITPEKIAWIKKVGDEHGFTVAPFYWGNEKLDEKSINALQTGSS